MKKNLWMFGMAVAALTGCTQNEVLDIPESRTIQFDTFVGKSTRAAIPINQAQDNNQYNGNTPPMSNLFQFWVYGNADGVPKFDGTDARAKVYFKKENNTFTYDNHLTWEFGKTYNFAAYSDGNYPLTVNAQIDTEVETSPTNITFNDLKTNENVIYGSKLSFNDYAVSNHDLLAAITKTESLPSSVTEITPVPLTFEHMLALINIRLENNTKDLYMQVNNIAFSGIIKDDCHYVINKGNSGGSNREIIWDNLDNSYNETNNQNNSDAVTGQYTFIGTGISATNTDGYCTNNLKFIAPGESIELTYFVIPQSNQDKNNITLETQSYHRSEIQNNEGTSFQYKLSNVEEDTKTHTISLAIQGDNHKSWQPGYRYNYTGSLAANAHFIHFTVETVTDWIHTEAGTIITGNTSNQ